MTIPSEQLKLFVVGESSGDPDDWKEYPNCTFVMSRTPEEALELCGEADDRNPEVAEVKPKEPTVLCHYFAEPPEW
jgi:hypothetical protein